MAVMDQNDLSENHVNVKALITETNNEENTKKCNSCDFVSFLPGDLRRHLKTHGGEKSNKCNQCDFASSRAANLRRHLKTHGGEESN